MFTTVTVTRQHLIHFNNLVIHMKIYGLIQHDIYERYRYRIINYKTTITTTISRNTYLSSYCLIGSLHPCPRIVNFDYTWHVKYLTYLLTTARQCAFFRLTKVYFALTCSTRSACVITKQYLINSFNLFLSLLQWSILTSDFYT